MKKDRRSRCYNLSENCRTYTPVRNHLTCCFFFPMPFGRIDGRLSVVLYLLEAGANPDGVPLETGGCGATPLHRWVSRTSRVQTDSWYFALFREELEAENGHRKVVPPTCALQSNSQRMSVCSVFLKNSSRIYSVRFHEAWRVTTLTPFIMFHVSK